MYPAPFEYYKATSVAEASELLSRHADSRLLAGGHSLLPAMKLRLASPPALIDIGGLNELRGVKVDGKTLRIGALTTHAEVADSADVKKSCGILAEAASQIGDLQVRNCGTIGGSLAHADPAADLPTVMLATGAALTAAGAKGTREIAAADFFVDLFTTSLRAGELLTGVAVPITGAGGAYLKHRHPASSYAVVGVAAVVEVKRGRCEKAAIAVGGVTGAPVRAAAAEQALHGKAPDEAACSAAAAKVAEALREPLGDHYASGEFRVHLAGVLAKRALRAAAERAGG